MGKDDSFSAKVARFRKQYPEIAGRLSSREARVGLKAVADKITQTLEAQRKSCAPRPDDYKVFINI